MVVFNSGNVFFKNVRLVGNVVVINWYLISFIGFMTALFL